jgi:hypothetical protein
MSDQRASINWRREELFSLLSSSAALAGLCIMVVALMNTFDKKRASVSIVDDIFGVCAAAFVLTIYLIFWVLRSNSVTTLATLIKIIEGVFLLALTSMTLATFMMIYTIW